jgi:hypothetical protein
MIVLQGSFLRDEVRAVHSAYEMQSLKYPIIAAMCKNRTVARLFVETTRIYV